MVDTQTERVLQQLPAPTRHTLEGILEEPAMTTAELREEVSDYLERLDEAASRVPSADPAAGREVGELCLDLLDSSGAAEGEEPHPLIQGALRYFATADDAESDLSSGGFDDDLQVITAVREELGL